MGKEIYGTIAVMGIVGFALLYTQKANFAMKTELNSIDNDFTEFLAKHGKSYMTKEEYNYRREIFEKNKKQIQDHNSKEGQSFKLALNKFADMTEYEFGSMLGEINSDHYQIQTIQHKRNLQATADPIDWRDKGYVAAVRNQQSCGSCWAFSTAGVAESHWAIKNSATPAYLSTQQLVDCAKSYGNDGCDGGYFRTGFAYVQDHGLALDSSYSYRGLDGPCSDYAYSVEAKSTGTVAVGQTPDDLKSALQNGPVAISLYASYHSFRFYSSGILNDTLCPTTINHAVITVGWGKGNETEGNQEYFIVRNSWGDWWGEQGYIRLAVTDFKLGICGMFYRIPMYPSFD